MVFRHEGAIVVGKKVLILESTQSPSFVNKPMIYEWAVPTLRFCNLQKSAISSLFLVLKPRLLSFHSLLLRIKYSAPR